MCYNSSWQGGPQGFPEVLVDPPHQSRQDPTAIEEPLPDLFIKDGSLPALRLGKSNSSPMLADLEAAEADDEKQEKAKSVPAPTMHNSTEFDLADFDAIGWPENRISIDGHGLSP